MLDGHFARPHKAVGEFHIEPGMNIADFGAGSGAYTFAIAEALGGSGVVYAIDIQQPLIRRIQSEAKKKNLSTVEILWCDLEHKGTHLKEHSMDKVLLSNILFQVEEKEKVVAEAARILAPHGRLIVIDWSESFGLMGPHKKDVVSKSDMLSLLEAMSFSLEKEFSPGAHHYGLILKRS